MKETIDWKAKTLDLLKGPELEERIGSRVFKTYKTHIFKWGFLMNNKLWRQVYESMQAGDPKIRNLRGIQSQMWSKQNKEKRV